jgi:hypothetical protein
MLSTRRYQMYNTIPLDSKLDTATFKNMCEAMFGTLKDQVGIGAGLDLGQSSISNFIRGSDISRRSGNKIITVWNAFIENGSLPKQTGSIDKASDADDGTRPFVSVPMVRDRVSGRIYTAEKVESGLIGSVTGQIQSPEEVVARIDNRFNIMIQIVRRMTRGKVRSQIVQAAPGVGKTYRIEKELAAWHADTGGNYNILSGGGVTAASLFKSIYNARDGGVVVLDDNDSFLDDTESKNMLKNALDSSATRILTWTKQSNEVYSPAKMRAKAERMAWMEAERDAKKGTDDARAMEDIFEDLTFGKIPDTFEFNGAMIFITNKNLKAKALAGDADLEAMIDRSLYTDLTISNLRDKSLWCDHVFANYMTDGLTPEQVTDIREFMVTNMHQVFSMSLRRYLMISELAADAEAGDWKNIAKATMFK